ncbi:histidine phosphatase family protein [Mesoterricola silvestris]|uniref:Alpha-ribazole phosphatase n=1 Tax=Mesoterricola silvestris TaxID=2927979 RepID=A0AA48K774_9BACT|nr:histidine phosphatase family protein [Mesoterricola silvestris]BDU70880.1 alpha-ribazole phosphatase [Mesoterricola silvestris]
MMPLYLLRHGPTEASAKGAPLGRLDLPVAPEGQARWPRVREELLALGIGRVLTSDLGRARDHALDLGLPCLVLPGLSEQAFGEWEARPWDQVEGAEAFFRDPARGVPPGGESFLACGARALLALQGALEGEGATLVLAHGGPLRAILAHYIGLPATRALDLSWQPFGLTRVDVYAPDRGALRFHNRLAG